MADLERMYPGLTALATKGSLLVPTHISWRRAAKLVKAGLASLYPFHQRWQGRLDITDQGRLKLPANDGPSPQG